MSERLLKVLYQEVLTGFEDFNFTEEQLKPVELYLQTALNDLRACQECDGETCKTSINYKIDSPFKGYWALNREFCEASKEPSFAVHRCPGAKQRKAEILELLQPARKW